MKESLICTNFGTKDVRGILITLSVSLFETKISHNGFNEPNFQRGYNIFIA